MECFLQLHGCMKKLPTIISASLGLLLLPAASQESEATVKEPAKVSPWQKSDGEWITISGKVTSAGVNLFVLDYGKGAITVEIDDYDRDLEGFNIVKDDKVIVVGRVDADEGQKRTIEASSVYVKSIGKSFFASADDEEEAVVKLRKATLEGRQLALKGKVTMVAKDFLTLDTGYQLIDVSTQAINGQAITEDKKVTVKVGDKITVLGAVTDGFLDSNKLMASQIIEH